MTSSMRRSIRLGTLAVVVTAFLAPLFVASPASALPPGPPTDGYVLLAGDGGIFPWNVPFAGAPASDPTRCPRNVTDRNKPHGTCVSMALTPSGLGYWVLNGDTGKVYAYGTAGFYGDPAQSFAGVGREFVPNGLAIVATPTGAGYWVLESGLSDTGTVYHFGDAGFFGDTTTIAMHTGAAFAGVPVGLAAAPDGKGYWQVDSDGGVFAFGSAKFYGSMSGRPLAGGVVGIAAAPDGKGYWLVASDGGVFAFGSARFAGSMHGHALVAPIVGMARNPRGAGYWLASADGGVFAFGGAPFLGSMGGIALQQPIFAIAAKNSVLI
jgi:hypothetical protein